MKIITVYTMPNCVYCTRIKEWLMENQIKYKEVGSNEIVDTDLIDTIQGFPFTIVKEENGDEHTVLGFNIDMLQKLI
ncbi:hypothetical protein KQI74_22635 [Paenibacillus barcinonensis]|uniref:glutaredoxin domain-containing protein n=1 Tax=Paenibacillus barcinonensis TaxID=198119 RepID=UPI001C0FA5EF|nr:glutaredoxin domain-containing protein [Paenibacillus barcinonensis]MBU5355086.1 hypothetical protein [Paenibacillus barcinonensis]